jgi:hypothetical protein
MKLKKTNTKNNTRRFTWKPGKQLWLHKVYNKTLPRR